MTNSPLSKFLPQLFLFMNALLLSGKTNLALISCLSEKSEFLYPNNTEESEPQRLQDIRDHIFERLTSLVIASEEVSREADTRSTLSGALSMSLCYINKVIPKFRISQSRILVISVSSDVSAQYIPIMNSIFAAQKINVMIDACILASDSSYLQQAADLSGGVYLKPQFPGIVLQYLFSFYAGNGEIRKYIRPPQLTDIDFRASCFCHRKLIEIGFVCSVCLSIYCDLSAVCSTCGTRFPKPDNSIARKRSKKKD